MNPGTSEGIDHNKRTKGAIVKIDSKCYPIFLGVNTVGRNKTAVVNIKHLNVSQAQALLILVNENQHFLTDMNSSNGTYIENTKLVPFKLYELVNNAQIKFGDVQATYLKLSSCVNTTVNLESSALEMTQNMTQNFYAANTQLISDDESILDHNYNASVIIQSGLRTVPVEDIHEIATQKVHFPSQLFTNVSESSSESTQIVIQEEIGDIHDAPTQVVVYNPPTVQDEIKNSEPTKVSIFSDTAEENFCQPPDDISTVNQRLDNSKVLSNKNNEFATELSEPNLPKELGIEEGNFNKKVEYGSPSSSPGPSMSRTNKTFENSVLDNSKDESTLPGSEIEETVLDDKLEDSCINEKSNDSLDFLTMGLAEIPGDENKENIGGSVKENSESIDSVSRPNEKAVNNQISTPDSHSAGGNKSQNSSQNTSSNTLKIKNMKKMMDYKKDDSDTEIETTQDIIKPKKKPLRKLSTNSDSESDIEATQDIGVLKKPVKKLESDDEASVKEKTTNSDSDTDCEGDLDLVNKNTDNMTKEISKELVISLSARNLEIEESGLNKKANTDHLELNKNSPNDLGKDKNKFNSHQSVTSFNKNASDSETDCEEDLEKVCKGEDTISKRDSIISDQTDDKLNDTDCIPATQDAFAEAFNYQSDPGKSSSTEDFRLGLTQLMEDSENGDKSKNENIAAIGSQEHTEKVCKENVEDDLYCMPTQRINEPPKASCDDDQETEDAYLMPTQPLFKTKNTPSSSSTTRNNLYNLPTQQISEFVKDSGADEEIYMLSTQPINKESQFKVPKSFTFKKKTVLEQSLTTLLSDNNKDNDIYDIATQKIGDSSETQKNSDEFDTPIQILVEPSISDNDNAEKDTGNDSYLQPTQCLETATQVAPVSVQKEDVKCLENGPVQLQNINIVRENRPEEIATDVFVVATQPATLQSHGDVNTQQELELCTSTNVPVPDKVRPDNPVAEILDEVSCKERSPEKHNLRRSRRKSSSNDSLSEKLEEKLKHSVSLNVIETEGQAEKSPEVKSRSVVSLYVIKEEEQAEQFPAGKSWSVVDKADDDDNAVETLSQIEAFIKKPIVRTSFKSRISKPAPLRTSSTDPLPSSSTKRDDEQIPLNEEEIVAPKRTSKRKMSVKKETDATIIKLKSTDKEQLETNSESESNESFRDVKSDIDQSFALLKSKATKSRKKMIDPVIQDLKVSVTSHRRSMSIAESSVTEANNSKRITIESSSSRTKRKTEKESPEIEVPQKRSTRGKSKTDTGNNVEVVIPNNRKRRGTSVDTKCEENVHKAGPSSTRTTAGKSFSDKSSESSEDTSKRNIKEVTRKGPKSSTASKSVETTSSDDYLQYTETTPGKRKRETKTASSRNAEVGSEGSNGSDLCHTPKKQRSAPMDELLNSAERAKRKLKPKVVFTMMDDPQLESLIRQLGGSIVDSVNTCTVLVTEHVKRSQKLLAAVGQGKPICSPQWIKESKKAGEFLDPWDFILKDREAETKWNFSLHESLNRAKNEKLLNNYIFQILVNNATDVLKGAIEASGGKSLSKFPTKGSGVNLVVVASPDQRSKYGKIVKQNPNIKVVEPEAVFDGVLRQEMRLTNHLLT